LIIKIFNQELNQGTHWDIALATAFAAGPVSEACEVLEEKEGLPPRMFVKMMLGKNGDVSIFKPVIFPQ